MTYEIPRNADGSVDQLKLRQDFDDVARALVSDLTDYLPMGYVLLYNAVNIQAEDPNGYVINYYCGPDMDFARAAGIVEVGHRTFFIKYDASFIADEIRDED